jgi:hypothetical protein
MRVKGGTVAAYMESVIENLEPAPCGSDEKRRK